VADHLHALRLAARQRARRAVEAQVAEPDLDEGVERLLERLDERTDVRVGEIAEPHGEVGDLHRRGIRDVDALDLRGERRLIEP
jgi:hypothetical protein